MYFIKKPEAVRNDSVSFIQAHSFIMLHYWILTWCKERLVDLSKFYGQSVLEGETYETASPVGHIGVMGMIWKGSFAEATICPTKTSKMTEILFLPDDAPVVSIDRREITRLDKAWELDYVTNYKLANGDTVDLLGDTAGDFSEGYVLVPKGTKGVVIQARTPKVKQKRGTGLYFANVDCEMEGIGAVRIRVPHNALHIIRQPKTSTQKRVAVAA